MSIIQEQLDGFLAEIGNPQCDKFDYFAGIQCRLMAELAKKGCTYSYKGSRWYVRHPMMVKHLAEGVDAITTFLAAWEALDA